MCNSCEIFSNGPNHGSDLRELSQFESPTQLALVLGVTPAVAAGIQLCQTRAAAQAVLALCLQNLHSEPFRLSDFWGGEVNSSASSLIWLGLSPALVSLQSMWVIKIHSPQGAVSSTAGIHSVVSMAAHNYPLARSLLEMSPPAAM